jgi:hypothetical protein
VLGLVLGLGLGLVLRLWLVLGLVLGLGLGFRLWLVLGLGLGLGFQLEIFKVKNSPTNTWVVFLAIFRLTEKAHAFPDFSLVTSIAAFSILETVKI